MQETFRCTKPVNLAPTAIQGKVAKGNQLYVVTVGVLSGRALAIERNSKNRNGWELWKQLAVNYEPA